MSTLSEELLWPEALQKALDPATPRPVKILPREGLNWDELRDVSFLLGRIYACLEAFGIPCVRPVDQVYQRSFDDGYETECHIRTLLCFLEVETEKGVEEDLPTNLERFYEAVGSSTISEALEGAL